MVAETTESTNAFPPVATRLGLGGGPLGGLFEPVTAEAAEAVVEGAWDHGIRRCYAIMRDGDAYVLYLPERFARFPARHTTGGFAP